MRVMVLGATGCIGGQIARAAHEAGWDVSGLRRRPGAVGAVSDLPITWHEGDLSDTSRLVEVFQGCDVLFHAAGHAPGGEYNIRKASYLGVQQMRRVLEAARMVGVSKVIYTSSLSTIGPAPAGADRLADERDGYVPGTTRNAYYEVKWLMEYEAVRATQAGLPVMILAPTAVFSPGDVKPSTSEILLLLARGMLPAAVDVETNMVDGRDVALAHVRAVDHGEPGRRYIIGGYNFNVGEAMQQAAQILGVKAPRRVLKLSTVAGLLRFAQFLRIPIPATMRAMPYWQPLNCQLGWDTFGFEPRPFEDTVRDTVAWFREHGYL